MPHAGHAFAEDLLDAVSLMTSIVGMSLVLAASGLVHGLRG